MPIMALDATRVVITITQKKKIALINLRQWLLLCCTKMEEDGPVIYGLEFQASIMMHVTYIMIYCEECLFII